MNRYATRPIAARTVNTISALKNFISLLPFDLGQGKGSWYRPGASLSSRPPNCSRIIRACNVSVYADLTIAANNIDIVTIGLDCNAIDYNSCHFVSLNNVVVFFRNPLSTQWKTIAPFIENATAVQFESRQHCPTSVK